MEKLYRAFFEEVSRADAKMGTEKVKEALNKDSATDNKKANEALGKRYGITLSRVITSEQREEARQRLLEAMSLNNNGVAIGVDYRDSTTAGLNHLFDSFKIPEGVDLSFNGALNKEEQLVLWGMINRYYANLDRMAANHGINVDSSVALTPYDVAKILLEEGRYNIEKKPDDGKTVDPLVQRADQIESYVSGNVFLEQNRCGQTKAEDFSAGDVASLRQMIEQEKQQPTKIHDYEGDLKEGPIKLLSFKSIEKTNIMKYLGEASNSQGFLLGQENVKSGLHKVPTEQVEDLTPFLLPNSKTK